MEACPRLNTLLRIIRRLGGRSSGWIVTLGRMRTPVSSSRVHAKLVVNSLWRGAELGHNELGAFAIMAITDTSCYCHRMAIYIGVSQAEEHRWASAHATWRAKLDPRSVGTSAGTPPTSLDILSSG